MKRVFCERSWRELCECTCECVISACAQVAASPEWAALEAHVALSFGDGDGALRLRDLLGDEERNAALRLEVDGAALDLSRAARGKLSPLVVRLRK